MIVNHDYSVYIAGPLFTEADQVQRNIEESDLRWLFSQYGIKGLIFNPLNAPFQDKDPDSATIFKGDYNAINLANTFFFDLATNDPGTLVELGIVIKRYMQDENIRIYPVISDFRVHGRTKGGFESAIGYNSFVIGALTFNNINIYTSFKEALKAFETNLVNKNE